MTVYKKWILMEPIALYYIKQSSWIKKFEGLLLVDYICIEECRKVLVRAPDRHNA